MLAKELIIISVFSIVLTQSSSGQTALVDSLFKEFRSDIVEQEKNKSRVHLNDETDLRYYSFLEAASIDELVSFINDSSASVRCLVYSGLVGKGADLETLEEIADTYKNDSAIVRLMSTDVVIGWTVSERMQLSLDWIKSNPGSTIDYSSKIEKIKAQQVVAINGANFFGEISKDALYALDSIYSTEELMSIISFEMYFKDKLYQSESNQLTSEMKSALQEVQEKDKVFFEDIRVFISADSTVRKVANVALEVQ